MLHGKMWYTLETIFVWLDKNEKNLELDIL